MGFAATQGRKYSRPMGDIGLRLDANGLPCLQDDKTGCKFGE